MAAIRHALVVLACVLLATEALATDSPVLERKWRIQVNDNGSVQLDCEAEPHFCEASSNHSTPWRAEPWFQRAPKVELKEKNDHE